MHPAMKHTSILPIMSLLVSGALSGCLDVDETDAAVTSEDVAVTGVDATAVRCRPSIRFQNRTADGNGRVFDEQVPNPTTFARAAAQRVCKVLYRTASEVPRVPFIKLVIEDFDGVAWADPSAHEVHVSSLYLAGVAQRSTEEELRYEITGVIDHELTHVYQHLDGPGWLIEGMADFVRLHTGFIPESNRGRGGHYDDAYQTTAFFLDWIDDAKPGFGYEVNQSMRDGDGQEWTLDVFQQLTGTDVDTLWNQYQDSLPLRLGAAGMAVERRPCERP